MNSAIEYVMDNQGQPSAVVIPIDIWKSIFPEGAQTTSSIIEGIEDYCLNKAMDEAKETALLNREDALAFLAEEAE